MKPGSKAWKNFMSKLYGFGAAIVIFGALFKIMHWPGAGMMLTVGLTTEAIIFIFSAFEPIHEDPDWSLVYPELGGLHGDDHHGEEEAHAEGEEEAEEEPEQIEEHVEEFAEETVDDGSITEQLDNMLEEAKIEPELIASLGEGLKNLKDQTAAISDVSDASLATNEYVENMRGASRSVGELSESYVKASEALSNMSMDPEQSNVYSEHIQNINTNLSSLNAAYELQLKSVNEQVESSNVLYGSIHELMQNLKDSVEDTKKYKENISQLSDNLQALNTVYGNMLTAMNFGGAQNQQNA